MAPFMTPFTTPLTVSEEPMMSVERVNTSGGWFGRCWETADVRTAQFPNGLSVNSESQGLSGRSA